jgi:hypothetical protein
MTIRGADTDAFCAMGACLGDLLRVPSDPRIDPVVREQVRSLADRYPVPRTHVLPH